MAFQGSGVLTAPVCASKSKLPQEYREEVKPTARIAGKPPADALEDRSADGTLPYKSGKWLPRASAISRPSCGTDSDYRTILDQKISVPEQ